MKHGHGKLRRGSVAVRTARAIGGHVPLPLEAPPVATSAKSVVSPRPVPAPQVSTPPPLRSPPLPDAGRRPEGLSTPLGASASLLPAAPLPAQSFGVALSQGRLSPSRMLRPEVTTVSS